MTYFAFDGPQPDVAGAIVDEITALQHALAGPRVTVCAMVDCAFDESFFAQAFRTSSPRISLYEKTQLRTLGQAAPFFVQAPDRADDLANWVERLLAACDARPMWSVIVSAIGMDELASHISSFLIARCEDKLEWPVRWADARILPALLSTLPPEITQDLLRPVYRWFATSRQGELLSWSGSGARPGVTAPHGNMQIDDAIFARLVDAAEADAVLAQIYDTEPELLRHRQPSDCYRLVCRQLEIADEFGIDQPGPRKHFCAMALYLKEDFLLAPDMQALLTNVKAGRDYYSEIALLSADFWAKLG
jgi:hypothetical protein